MRDHGGLDVFYANAGIGGSFGSLFEASVDEWNAVLRVNLVGPFLVDRVHPLLEGVTLDGVLWGARTLAGSCFNRKASV